MNRLCRLQIQIVQIQVLQIVQISHGGQSVCCRPVNYITAVRRHGKTSLACSRARGIQIVDHVSFSNQGLPGHQWHPDCSASKCRVIDTVTILRRNLHKVPTVRGRVPFLPGYDKLLFIFITILHYSSNHSFIYYLLLYSIIRIEKFYTQLKVTSVSCFIIVLPAWVFRYLTLAPAAASCYTFPIYSPEPTNYWTRLVAALYHSQPHFLSKITLFIKNIPHPIIYLQSGTDLTKIIHLKFLIATISVIYCQNYGPENSFIKAEKSLNQKMF